MTPFRTLILALGLAAAIQTTAQAAPADTAPSTASVEKLLQVMHAEKILDSLRPQIDNIMKSSMAQMSKGQQLNADEQKVMDDYRNKVIGIMQESLTMAKLKPLYVSVYSKNFSQQEINGLITFYESPAGQAYTEKMPAVMQDIMQQMSPTMEPMMQQIVAAAKDANAKMDALRAQKK
jgi:hypothetical protein